MIILHRHHKRKCTICTNVAQQLIFTAKHPIHVEKMGCPYVELWLLLFSGCACARGALPDALPASAVLYERDCSGCSNGQSGEPPPAAPEEEAGTVLVV